MITIITITKNDYEGITRTIVSTRNLRNEYNFKQIVIDSSDTLIKEKVENLLINEKNIEYLWKEPKGISNAFNYGINAAKTDWVWFLNGGDAVDQEFPLPLLPMVISKTSADFLIFQIKYSESKQISPIPSISLQWPPALWIPHPSIIIKKVVFEKYGNFDERFKLLMDYEFWLRSFSKDTNVDIISIPLTIFDESGMSRNLKKEVAREFLRSILYRSIPILKSILVNWKRKGKILFRMIRKSI